MTYLSHVLFCSHHQLVEDNPFWLILEQRTRRMNVHRLAVNTRSITFLRIALGCVAEEAGTNGALDTLHFTTTTHDFQLVSIHDCEQLFADVLK